MKQHTHWGVYALAMYDDQVIRIHKGRGPYRGKWDLPGGRIEFGESPRETLERELMEETGLKVEGATLLDVVPTRFSHKLPDGSEEDLHHLGVLYRVLLPSLVGLKGEADGHDSLGSRVVSIREAGSLDLTPFARLAIEKEILRDAGKT